MSLTDFGLTQSLVSTLMLLYSFLAFILFASLVFLFFLRGFGIYKISKKLNCDNGWYAFAPILNGMALGDAADKVSKDSNFKNLLLAVRLIKLLLNIIFAAAAIVFSVKLLFAADLAVLNGVKLDSAIFKDAIFTVVVFVFSILSAIFYGVLNMLCAIKIYNALNVNLAVLKAVIGFILPFTFPFFVYLAVKEEKAEDIEELNE